MRVLALAQSVEPTSGWGRYADELARAMRDLGVAFDVLVERGQPDHAATGVRARLRRGSHDLPSLAAAALEAPWLAPIARRYDLIHALDETKLPLAAAISALAGRPFAASVHGSHVVRLLEKRGPIYRPLLARSRRLFAASGYTRARLMALAPGLDAMTLVAPLGVRQVFAAPLSAAERGPVVLSLGAPKARKGVREALAAVIELRPAYPGLKLVVAGGFDPADTYVASLRSDALRADAPEALVLRGRIDNEAAAALLNTARVLLMPSQNLVEGFEGFGLVHLEAAARGLPSIGSRNSGNEDAIRDGSTGLLVPQGDHPALVAALSKLLGDDNGWNRMSAAAAAFAREMSWRRTAELTLAGYSL